MGTYIMQAADERVLAPNCSFMFHIGSIGYADNHPQIVRNWVKYDEYLDGVCDSILMDKIREKHPEFKDKKFKEMNMFDTILTAQEAIDLGLADRLLRDGELSE
jgi:ATP-dependent protease ClpP protease subunit